MVWTDAGIPDQHGRLAVVTGANRGLGFHTARVLAEHGASVVLAVRDVEAGKRAAARIAAAAPGAEVTVQHLDLASLESVRAAANALTSRYPTIDLLINNAGVMCPPKGITDDGVEVQFGANHLGPFALTGLLLDRMLATPGSRVVTVSSVLHRMGTIRFDDLQPERSYGRLAAYTQSKLANLMFSYELDRRLSGTQTVAVTAHPGLSKTDLGRSMVTLSLIFRLFGQPVETGALPILRAATDPAVRGGEYYGPGGFQETRGYPVLVESSAKSHDQAVQRRLWTVSEQLTGVTYPV